MKEKFELFIGYLGNGATVCNKAVYSNGDYKTIAHISNAGNIKLYVKPDYIPAAAMARIEKIAADHKNKTIEFINNELTDTKYHSFNDGYFYLLEQIDRYTSYSDVEKLLKDLRGKTNPEKADLIKEYYLLHF